jgi:glycosyltransferase involved in cell wall biosynthesis
LVAVEKITLVYLIEGLHQLAGMERIVAEKMNYLSAHTDWQLHLCTYQQQGRPLPFALSSRVAYHEWNVPSIDRLQSPSTLAFVCKYYKMRKVFRRQLETFLNEVKPQVIVVPTYAFSVLDILMQSAEKRGVKVVLESHVQSKKVLLAYKYWYRPWLRRVWRRWDDRILRSLQPATVITLTHHDSEFWQDRVGRIRVVPNMLTIHPVPVRSYAAQQVVAAGRYTGQKGFDLLIKAWDIVVQQYPKWRLVIYGNGPREEYQAQADQLGIGEHVQCCPATSDIVSRYAESSIFVLSSRYEGFGLVLTEAMSCGLPCVSFDCPYGPSEIIREGEDGFLVPAEDVAALADRLMQLMQSEELRRSMGELARRNVMRYSPERVMEEWKNAILEFKV